MKNKILPIKNIESTKINIKDRIFSLIQHICDGDKKNVSFSLKVSYKDPKKSNGFVNDSFYLHNKEEVQTVINLLIGIYNDANQVVNKFFFE